MQKSVTTFVHSIRLVSNIVDKDMFFVVIRRFTIQLSNRKFYLIFPKSETLSHQLTWSHYFELLKCDDPVEMQFYMKECINEG